MGELYHHKNIKQTNYFKKMMYTFIKCSVTQNSVSLEVLVTNQGTFSCSFYLTRFWKSYSEQLHRRKRSRSSKLAWKQ